jgi:hypothetical protein
MIANIIWLLWIFFLLYYFQILEIFSLEGGFLIKKLINLINLLFFWILFFIITFPRILQRSLGRIAFGLYFWFFVFFRLFFDHFIFIQQLLVKIVGNCVCLRASNYGIIPFLFISYLLTSLTSLFQLKISFRYNEIFIWNMKTVRTLIELVICCLA